MHELRLTVKDLRILEQTFYSDIGVSSGMAWENDLAEWLDQTLLRYPVNYVCSLSWSSTRSRAKASFSARIQSRIVPVPAASRRAQPGPAGGERGRQLK